MTAIVWFREDLRIQDNHALYQAGLQGKGVVGIYILNKEFLKKHDVAACRVQFILKGLQALSKDLESLNIPLLFYQVERSASIIKILKTLIREVEAEALYFNKQYEIDEKRRDEKICKILQKQHIACYSFHDQLILPPDSVRTQQSHFFKVFTPYRKTWLKKFVEIPIELLPAPKKQPKSQFEASRIPELIETYKSNIDFKIWPAGEKFARQRLKKFIKEKLFLYDKNRDYPALSATSLLSPYLSTGMISARECFIAAYEANQCHLESGNKGAVSWMSELIWREFYKYILINAPRVSMNKAYRIQTEKLPWKSNPKLFKAWCEGKTGVPIIDAAMRQLNSTGWMHNRLRMVTASFLVKNLELDWRQGEAYFMRHLIDGDLSANNGGWQWCASTGVDAMPYFRVFNPYLQSRRFDPQGKLIRQFCPELKTLLGNAIHKPSKKISAKLKYPQPVVDVEKGRRDFIAKYKKIVFNKN